MASYQQSTFQSSVVSSIYAEKHLHSFEPVMINIRAKPPRPKVAANAVMDFDNNNNHTQTRTTSAITTTVKPRKFLDLRISNKSLLVLNATLESTVKEQTDKIATMPSFEVMMETQQKQSEYLNKAPYDPNSPPLKSLPRVIFYRVAISARQFADKSREKIQGILISN
ncbi:7311_t:CDS:2 [Entrophospora sp. SA101]|nr:4117_t:CDS:2 [Entrophospora sp. SA101]CAJ0633198.1 7311_t:CDS:2 [Entrophospora sp. SA101]